jgi:hypothetical protein
VDELGAAYRTAVLPDVEGLQHVPLEVIRSNYFRVADTVLSVLRGAVNGNVPLEIDAAGKDVECAIRSRNDDRLVFCLNWEKQPVDVGLALQLGAGEYSVRAVTMDELLPLRSVANESSLPAGPRRFRLELGAGEPIVLEFAHGDPSRKRDGLDRKQKSRAQ